MKGLQLAFCMALLGAGCGESAPQEPPGFSSGGAAGFGAAGGAAGSGASAGAGGSGSQLCPVSIRYKPAAGASVSQVAVAGDWNQFDSGRDVLTGPDSAGQFSIALALTPGMHAYKLVLDGSNWTLDPAQGYRRFVDGTENSGLPVADCTRPQLSVERAVTSRSGAGASFVADVRITQAVSGAASALTGVQLAQRFGASTTQVPASALSLTGDLLTISLGDLRDGKHTLTLSVTDAAGARSPDLVLPFWVEARAFEWRDALIYMAVTDRFQDGDSSNDPPPNSAVTDPRGDWSGGDLRGVRQRIADGTLDQLGIRALWLTPFQTNPPGEYPAADGVHQVTGYHGYWPVQPREVDPRLGGAAALHALVQEAHAHGIRVLMDFVLNHVHQSHPYVSQHPDWFRTGCVCGGPGCDWTERRLDCLFTDYLPDVNWTVNAASDQLVDDAVWWLKEFDLDGIRVDAVKHVEDAAIANLSTRVRETFETAGARYFLMGETAMGWSDCGLECNQAQYDTISSYIGPHGLDGQFDFVLYHAVPYRVFAYDDNGMSHADYWTQQSLVQYPPGSIMTPFIGSHDSSRFVTLATYRGQPGFDRGVASHQWSDLPGPPTDGEPYARHRLALAWLLTQPGAPLLYYGDEYGEFGGADPGNRAMWKSGGLTAEQQTTLSFTRALGQARQGLAPLRRGSYRSLYATEDFLAFAREYNGQAVIVALSRSQDPTQTRVSLPQSLGLADGTTLRDQLSSQVTTAQGGQIDIDLGPYGAAILAL